MSEMADVGEDHGHALFVCCGDYFVVADGAAWLDYCGGAGFAGFFYAVGEGEEGVAGYYCAF